MSVLDNSQTTPRTTARDWLRRGESRLRLQTIVRLRWLAVLGQSATVIIVYWVMGIDLPIGGCFAVISLSAWLNVVLRIRYPASQRLKSHYAFLMLGYDVLQLGALLYLTGGLENPFAFLLIAPVTVSASALPPRVTVALGGLAIVVATVLTKFHHPLPWFHHSTFFLPFPYLMGVWAAVVSGILFIGFYSWRTAEEARRMAGALAAAELVLAREQKLSALDGLAAAAAHGLGTPLATIAVVAKELLRNAGPADPHYDDLLLLRAQAERCRTILGELAGMGEQHDFIVSRLPLSHLIEEAVAPHRLVAAPIEVAAAPGIKPGARAAQEPVMQRNPGVIYGLGNLVENAIDFAASQVEVEASWSEAEVRIEIADDGEGFPLSVLEQLGEPFVTTRPGHGRNAEELDEHVGMGLGFFIAKTLLERSGARIELANRALPPGGAVVTVVWPRARFEQVPEGVEWAKEPVV
jgi:two-component system sensor histidine kinase RegB